MFREMRRSRQQLPAAECEALLRQGTSGVLALAGDDGYPYAVPLSYVFAEGRLFFHCAPAGHKLDAVRRCDKASFCVIGQDRVAPLEYTTHYRSVIAFGRIRILTGEAERRAAVEALALKYAPEDTAARREAEIRRYWPELCLLELTVEHLTGKECIELTRQRGSRAP